MPNRLMSIAEIMALERVYWTKERTGHAARLAAIEQQMHDLSKSEPADKAREKVLA